MNISIYTFWSDIRVVCSLAGCKFFTEDLLFVPYFQMFPFFSLNMAKVMRSLSKSTLYKTHTQKSCNMCSTFFLLLAMYDVSQKRYPSFQLFKPLSGSQKKAGKKEEWAQRDRN